jgi:uncharacterized protein (DUF433 family)
MAPRLHDNAAVSFSNRTLTVLTVGPQAFSAMRPASPRFQCLPVVSKVDGKGTDAMSTATTYPHIVKNNGQPAYLESHPRTRVAMLVMDYLARGLSPDELVLHYPYLKVAEVYSAMAYYFDHRTEIDAEIQEELDQVTRDQTKPRDAIWHKLKAKGAIS